MTFATTVRTGIVINDLVGKFQHAFYESYHLVHIHVQLGSCGGEPYDA